MNYSGTILFLVIACSWVIIAGNNLDKRQVDSQFEQINKDDPEVKEMANFALKFLPSHNGLPVELAEISDARRKTDENKHYQIRLRIRAGSNGTAYGCFFSATHFLLNDTRQMVVRTCNNHIPGIGFVKFPEIKLN